MFKEILRFLIKPLVNQRGDIFGDDDAEEEAVKVQKKQSEWQRQMAETIWKETAPDRELARKEAGLKLGTEEALLPMYTKETMATYPQTMGLLREDVLREPGTSQLFQQGVGNIAAGLAPYGASPKGTAFQRMYTNLLGQDIENTRQARFQLAGYGTQPVTSGLYPTTGYGESAQWGGLSAQSSTNVSELLQNQSTNQMNMYGDMFGSAIKALPLLALL